MKKQSDMTPEEKELLFKDLCARLPYGVMMQYEHFLPMKIMQLNETCINNKYVIETCKPYLRSMSSMTEKEREELKQEHVKDEKLYAECLTKIAKGDNSLRGKVIIHYATDWCNKNHFDYRGLIPMGLALEAPEGMYKTE